MIRKILQSRYFYMTPVGISIAGLINVFRPLFKDAHSFWLDASVSVVLTFLLWEGNLQINHWLNRKMTWENGPLRRAATQSLINVVFSISSIYLMLTAYDKIICTIYRFENSSMVGLAIIMGTLVSVLLQAVEIGAEFFTQWKASLVEVERYKKEALNTQLQMLKGQINPHFLFNNLSVLNSLIEQDPVKASEFTSQFAKVYRHLLKNRDSELSTLEEELQLLDAYCYLLSIRFGDGIKIQKNIHENCKNLLLPSLALQILVENCIQHNIITLSHPLNIDIVADDEKVTVTNSLIPKANGIHGSGLGHNNISLRLKHYTDKKLAVKIVGNRYTVEVPLLKNT
jgi:two-component system LytT family sensor kinase